MTSANFSASSLPALSIKRPVLATVMSLLIIVAGVISISRLPVREYPDIDPPVVTVSTVYPGANSKVIESEITEIIESELAGIEGIRTMTSTSRDQVSNVVVEFVLERDIDIAAQDIRDKISRIASRLPENADDPVIAKADSDAQPIMWIRVQSDRRDLIDLAEYVDQEIIDYFQNVRGVSKVIFGGERRKSIQVMLDTKKLAYFGLTVLDVRKALKDNNIELPAGRILSSKKEFSVNFDAKLKTTKQYENLIIRKTASSASHTYTGVIRLKDVAQVTIAAENDRSFVRFNGNQGFGLGIVRQAKSNTIQISDDVQALLKKLKGKIPEDINLSIGYDSAQFIRLSLKELYSTIFIATLLVLLVIYFFLRNLRSTIIPGVAIPVSLIGVMAGLSIMGFTVNLMTLLGLIIAIGIVVDDSIIVLENIYRYIEEGMEPKIAAKKGAEEITLAVIATTAVLVSIFLPVAFMSGVTGRLLSEFAFSLCIATVISSFVALTLAPMLCSKVFRQASLSERKEKENFIIRYFGSFMDWLESTFANILSTIYKFKGTFILLVFALTLPITIYVYSILPNDFIPDEDRGTFFTIVQTETGSNLDYTDAQVRKVENYLSTVPEVETVISIAAFGLNAPGKVTSGFVITKLVDWKERSRKVSAIVGPLYGVFGKITEAFVLPIKPKSGPSGGFGALPIQLVLKSNDLQFLSKASAEITAQAMALPEIMFSKSDLSFDKPEITIDVDRDKALSLGLNIKDISETLEILFAGVDVTEFNDDGEKYEVIMKVPRKEKNETRKLGELAVRSDLNKLVLLSNIISIKETIGAEERNHHNRKSAVTISGSPVKGVTPADGLLALEALVNDYLAKAEDVPVDIEIDYKGASKELKDSNVALLFGFVVALIFAYLFLAAQFESFVSPLIIMLTVPLALLGAVLGLFIFQLFPFVTGLAMAAGAPFWIQFVIPQFSNISLNIYSLVGMIMLIGMATKNGILLVEFINQLIDEGKPVDEAIITASKLRLRPILMTAVSTILGNLPIALALGIGSESRQSLGVVIVVGMALSTLLSLFVIPCVCGMVYKNKKPAN